MENDLFILGDTNIKILDNGNNILDKYRDMSNRKFNFVTIPKNLFYLRFKKPIGVVYNIAIWDNFQP